MEILNLINEYIKYLYILLIFIVLNLNVILISKLKELSRILEYVNETNNDINKQTKEFEEKVVRIKYTLEHSIPFFAFLFFIIMVLISTFKDYFNTKNTKRNFAKSFSKQYGVMNLKFNPKKTKTYKKEFISQMRFIEEMKN